MPREPQKKFIVFAEVPVWANGAAEAAEKVRGHTSRRLGIRRPTVRRVEPAEVVEKRAAV